MRRKPLAAAVLLMLLAAWPASAVEYTVDTNNKEKTTGDSRNYTTLYGLRESLTSDTLTESPTTITIYGNNYGPGSDGLKVGSGGYVTINASDNATITLGEGKFLSFSGTATEYARVLFNSDGGGTLMFVGGAGIAEAGGLGATGMNGVINVGPSDNSLSGGLSISRNIAYSGGGTLYARMVHLRGGTNAFVQNTTNSGGGKAIVLGQYNVELGGGNNMFLGNTTQGYATVTAGTGQANDGIVLSNSTGTNIFVGNANTPNADDDAIGGAIALDGGTSSYLTISNGTNLFTGNSVTADTGSGETAYGGALYSSGIVNITKGLNVFANNSAASGGGAIYSVGNTNITATTDSGDMVFRGNTVGTDRNALSSGGAMYLRANEGRNLYFYDSIDAGGTAGLTINGAAANTGRVVFDGSFGSTTADKTFKSTGGPININNGVLSLKDATVTSGTALNVSGDAGSGYYGTLRAVGAGNSITTNTVMSIAHANSILSFDVTGESQASTATTPLLSLDVRSTGLGFSDYSTTTDIAGFENGAATYTLAKLTSVNGTFNTGRAGGTIKVRGEDLSVTRASGVGVVGIGLTGGNKTLTMTTGAGFSMYDMKWVGTSSQGSPAAWDASTAGNWNDGTAANKFLHGDSVLLAGADEFDTHYIDIQDAGVRVADTMRDVAGNQTVGATKAGLRIESGVWNISGGHIEGRNLGFYGTTGGRVIFTGENGQRTLEQRVIVGDGAESTKATIIAGAGHTLLITNELKTGDLADTIGGGAIAVEADSRITLDAYTEGSILLVGNKSSGDGGAIATGKDGTVWIRNNIQFIGNEAAGDGGAIHTHELSVNGGASFIGNSAEEDDKLGGAIFATGNVSVTTYGDSGNRDIIFRGNKDSTGANAIALASGTGGGDDAREHSFQARAGTTLYFYDPISTHGTANAEYTEIDFNDHSAATGRVEFNMIDQTSWDHQNRIDVTATTTVHRGTLALLGQTDYGYRNDMNGDAAVGSSFILSSDATLETDAKENRISAKTIEVEAGSTLAFDLSGGRGIALDSDESDIDNFINNTNSYYNITFNDATTLTVGDDSGEKVNVDIIRLAAQDGIYGLAYNNNFGTNSDIFDLDQIELTDTKRGSRYGTLELLTSDDGDKLYIAIDGSDTARDLTWTGVNVAADGVTITPNPVWESGNPDENASNNWKYDEDDDEADPPIVKDAPAQFKNGDSVTFDNTADTDKRDVTIHQDGVTVGEMTVAGSGYTFTGGDIEGEQLSIATKDDADAATSAEFASNIDFDTLDVTGDGTTAAFNGDASFDQGFNIDGTNINVTFENGVTAGDGGDYSRISGEGVVVTIKDDSRFDQDVGVSDGATLAVTGDTTFDFSNDTGDLGLSDGATLKVYEGDLTLNEGDLYLGGETGEDNVNIAVGVNSAGDAPSKITLTDGDIELGYDTTVTVALTESAAAFGADLDGAVILDASANGDLYMNGDSAFELADQTTSTNNIFYNLGIDANESDAKVYLTATQATKEEVEDNLISNTQNITGVSKPEAEASLINGTDGTFPEMLDHAFNNNGQQPQEILKIVGDHLIDNPGDYAGAKKLLDTAGIAGVSEEEIKNAEFLGGFVTNNGAGRLYSGDNWIASGLVMQNPTRAVMGTVTQLSNQVLNHGIVLTKEALSDEPPEVVSYNANLSLLQHPRRNNNRIWAGAFGYWEDMGTKNHTPGYDYKAHGLMVGYDRYVGPVVLGAAFGYARGDLDEDQIKGDGDIDSYNFNLYASYTHCSGFFGIVNAGYTYSENDIKRRANAQTTRFDYHTDTWNAGGRIGYQAKLGNFMFTPTLGLDYLHARNSDFTTSGGVYQRYRGVKGESFRLPVDLEAAYIAPLGCDSTLTLMARGGYAYDFLNDGVTGSMRYLGNGYTATAIRGVKPGHGSWSVGGGVKYESPRFDAELNYQYSGRSKMDNHQVTGTVGFKF